MSRASSINHAPHIAGPSDSQYTARRNSMFEFLDCLRANGCVPLLRTSRHESPMWRGHQSGYTCNQSHRLRQRRGAPPPGISHKIRWRKGEHAEAPACPLGSGSKRTPELPDRYHHVPFDFNLVTSRIKASATCLYTLMDVDGR